jgi:hypothetical protein
MIDLGKEIFEVERRLADERAESLRAFEEYGEHLRQQATSLMSLGALVAVGFVAGTLLQRRSAKAESSPVLGLVSVLASVIPAVIRARDEHRRRAAEEDYLEVEQSRGGAT